VRSCAGNYRLRQASTGPIEHLLIHVNKEVAACRRHLPPQHLSEQSALESAAEPQGMSMSILGALVRTLPARVAPVSQRLATLPGVDLALNPGDGRLVVVLEDRPALEVQQRKRWPRQAPGLRYSAPPWSTNTPAPMRQRRRGLTT